MTYNEFLLQPDSQKIILFEIDQSVPLEDTPWIKFENDIWMIKIAWSGKFVNNTSYGYGSWGWGDYGNSTDIQLPVSPRERVLKVSSVLADSQQLTENTSITNLRLNPDSYYWDGVNQILYINTVDGNPPNIEYGYLELGITRGFSNRAVYCNDLYYDPRIKSVPSINTKRDSLFFGKISFDAGSCALINTDGYFDGVESYYGAECRIYFGNSQVDFSEWAIISQGYVVDYSFTSDLININFQDNRRQLTTSVPTEIFDIATYPNIEADGNVISMAYGNIKRAPVICLNENHETATSFIFKICYHAITSIDAVFVDGKEVSFTSPNLTDATFVLATTVYEPGADVSCTFRGKDIDNPLDVIVDIIQEFTPINYNSSYFNTTVWDTVTLSLTQPISLFVNEKRQIIEIIEDICASIFTLFVVDPDGRFNAKEVDTEAATIAEINVDDIIQGSSIELPSSEYLNSIRVGYNKNHESEKFNWAEDNTQKDILFRKYRSNVDKEFETLLTTKADAEDYAAKLIAQFGGIFPVYSITTKTQFLDLVVGDNIKLQINIPNKYIKAQVMSKEIDLNTFTLSFTLRWIEALQPTTNIVELVRYKRDRTYETR